MNSAEGDEPAPEPDPAPNPEPPGTINEGMDRQDGSCESVPKEEECDVCGSCWYCAEKEGEDVEGMRGNTVS